ncbi:P-loop NTPase fold protein [Spiroplasma endosymbiont of Amphibalanus improvisus]|uniref:P-loop NTPase fold protein n=1 Tax=Spiroplasma endosymbiont of Amphibalanus improvisus TaxID=3066327 RepID=UPI00313F3160
MMLNNEENILLKKEIEECKQKIKDNKTLLKISKNKNNSKELKKQIKKDQKFITFIKEKYKNPFDKQKGIIDTYNSITTANKLYKSLEYIVKETSDNNDRTIISIVGDWGSGKSTIVNYLIWNFYANEIKKLNTSAEPKSINPFKNSDKEEFDLLKINTPKHELTSKNFIDAIIKDIEKQMNPYQAKIKTFSKTSYEAIKSVFSNSILSLPGSVLPPESSRNLKKIIHTKKPYLIIFDEFDKCSKDNIDLFLRYFKTIILDATDKIHVVIVMDQNTVNEKLTKLHPNTLDKFLNKHITHTINLNKWLKLNENNKSLELNNFQQQYMNNILNLTPKERKILIDQFNFFFNDFKNNINQIYNQKTKKNNFDNSKNLITNQNQKFWKHLALIFSLIKFPTTQQKIFKRTLKSEDLRSLIIILKLKYKNFSVFSLEKYKKENPDKSKKISDSLIQDFKNFQELFKIFSKNFEKEIIISEIWKEIINWLINEYKYF